MRRGVVMPQIGDGAASERAKRDRVAGVDPQPLFQKLKPGPGLPAERVQADQRRRLHGATVAVVDREGCDRLRVRSLARGAGVSTATFYKHFANADECVASTYEAFTSAAVADAATAPATDADWRAALGMTIASLMEAFACEPEATKLALVDIFAAGPKARKRIGRAVASLEGLLTSSFATAPLAVTPPRHLVAGMTSGLLHVARATTLTDRATELPEFADEIGRWMLSLAGPEVLSLLAGAREPKAPFLECDPLPAANPPRTALAIGDERDRLQKAAVKLAEKEGLSNLTASRIRAFAGVSRRRFDDCYERIDDCYLDGIERIAREAAADARSWSETSRRWEGRTCRFLLGVCSRAARSRTQTRLVLQGLSAGRPGLLRRQSMIDGIATTLKATVPACQRPSTITSEASVAAAWHIVQIDIATGRGRTLPLISPLLSYVVLAPIMGQKSAVRTIKSAYQTP